MINYQTGDFPIDSTHTTKFTHWQSYLPFPIETKGWECPKCGVVYNPSVQSCQCHAGKVTVSWDSTK